MKNRLKSFTALMLALIMCLFSFVACNDSSDNAPKLTEQTIKAELADDGELVGTLTIDNGTAENVKAFSYVIEDTNTSFLKSKSYIKGIIDKALNSPLSLTYNDLLVYNAFFETTKVVLMFYDTTGFDGDTCTDEVLSILCDGQSRTWNGWTISATVNQSSDSITIKAKQN